MVGHIRNTQVATFRFIFIVSHLFAVVVLQLEKDHCLRSGLRTKRYTSDAEFNSDFLDAETWFDFLLGLSYLCAAIELMSLFAGNAILHPGFNLLSAVTNAWGTVFVFWMAAEAWSYRAYGWVFVLFSATSAAVALFHNLQHMLFKSTLVRRLDVKI